MKHTVYRLYDGDEIAYVGITGSGLYRFDRHRRERDWWFDVTHAEFEHFPTKEEAAAREVELIHQLRPRGNVRSRSLIPIDRASGKELALHLSVSAHTVYQLERRGLLPVAGRTERGQPYFDIDEVERWARDGKAAEPATAQKGELIGAPVAKGSGGSG